VNKIRNSSLIFLKFGKEKESIHHMPKTLEQEEINNLPYSLTHLTFSGISFNQPIKQIPLQASLDPISNNQLTSCPPILLTSPLDPISISQLLESCHTLFRD
jgi:hypothetical protein